jgi:predicted nucleotide-binding protein
MVKKSGIPERLPPPNLVVSKKDADVQLEARIELGKKMLKWAIPTQEELSGAKELYRKWDDFNKEMLRRMFDSPEVSDEYRYIGFRVLGGQSFEEAIEDLLDNIRTRVNRLESIRERLILYKEPLGNISDAMHPTTSSLTSEKTVFIVHGRDDGSKETIARFLTRLGLKVTILHEQPNCGMTIMEKLEEYSSVAFAVILLTPDDEGRLARNGDLKPRARQNVVFELGYFIAKLGRNHVCPLLVEGVEQPSDFEGVVYVPYDDRGAWRFELAREIRAAGLDVDLNKIIE